MFRFVIGCLAALFLGSSVAVSRQGGVGAPGRSFSCHGCAERDAAICEEAMDSMGCTVMVRSRYVSYSEICGKRKTIVCGKRTCSFKWRFEGRLKGTATQCGYQVPITVTETSPDTSPVQVPLKVNSWTLLIPEVSSKGAICGFRTTRSGTTSSTGISSVANYSFKIGCKGCSK